MNDIYLGRQSIYNRDLELSGFELLYRHSEENRAEFDDGDMATARVILNTVTEMGLNTVVGQHRAFINVDRNFLIHEGPAIPVHPQLVFEFRADISTDDALLRAVRQLGSDGRRFALTHFDDGEACRALVEAVDYVKVDMLATPESRLRELVPRLREYGITLIAARIEGPEVLELCRSLGFDLFQGHYFSQPTLLKFRSVPTSHLAVLRLIGKLNDPRSSIQSIKNLIAQDVSLSYRVLRQINSAAYNLPSRVDSIHRAIVLMGIDAVKALATLLALANMEDQLDDLTTLALVRARMCELLAEHRPGTQGEAAFVVGLLSILDAVTQAPLPTILESLPLADHVNGALLHHEGPLGEILACALAYERGDWDAVDRSGLTPGAVSDAYFAALNHAYRAAFEMM